MVTSCLRYNLKQPTTKESPKKADNDEKIFFEAWTFRNISPLLCLSLFTAIEIRKTLFEQILLGGYLPLMSPKLKDIRVKE